MDGGNEIADLIRSAIETQVRIEFTISDKENEGHGGVTKAVGLFGILWFSHHRNDRVRHVTRTVVALFLGVHALLHLALASAPANEFQGPLSVTLIASAGASGAAYLLAQWRLGRDSVR